VRFGQPGFTEGSFQSLFAGGIINVQLLTCLN